MSYRTSKHKDHTMKKIGKEKVTITNQTPMNTMPVKKTNPTEIIISEAQTEKFKSDIKELQKYYGKSIPLPEVSKILPFENVYFDDVLKHLRVLTPFNLSVAKFLNEFRNPLNRETVGSYQAYQGRKNNILSEIKGGRFNDEYDANRAFISIEDGFQVFDGHTRTDIILENPDVVFDKLQLIIRLDRNIFEAITTKSCGWTEKEKGVVTFGWGQDTETICKSIGNLLNQSGKKVKVLDTKRYYDVFGDSINYVLGLRSSKVKINTTQFGVLSFLVWATESSDLRLQFLNQIVNSYDLNGNAAAYDVRMEMNDSGKSQHLALPLNKKILLAFHRHMGGMATIGAIQTLNHFIMRGQKLHGPLPDGIIHNPRVTFLTKSKRKNKKNTEGGAEETLEQ